MGKICLLFTASMLSQPARSKTDSGVTPHIAVAENDDGGICYDDLFEAELRIRVSCDVADIVSASAGDEQIAECAGTVRLGLGGIGASIS